MKVRVELFKSTNEFINGRLPLYIYIGFNIVSTIHNKYSYILGNLFYDFCYLQKYV